MSSVKPVAGLEAAVFSGLLDKVNQPVLITDLQGLLVFCNRAAITLLSHGDINSKGALEGHAIAEFLPALTPANELLTTPPTSDTLLRVKTACVTPSLTELTVWVSVQALLDSRRQVQGFAYLLEQAEALMSGQSAQQELSKYKQYLAAIVESSDDAIVSKTLDGIVTSWNKGAERIFGYTADEMVGQPLLKIFPPDRADEETHILSKLRAGEKVDHFQTIRLHKSGRQIHLSVTVSPIYNVTGQIIGASNIGRDITEKLHAEKMIWRQANYDTLTSLPNRRLLMDAIKIEVDKASREMHGLTIMFIDLDQFKEINDSLGHNVGDELLQLVSARIRECFRQSDMLARFGGDEFVALMPSLNQRRDIDQLSQKVLQSLQEPFTLYSGEIVYVSASIGIAVFPMDGENEQELIKHADQAMYEAKRKGRNQSKYFIPAMQTSLDKHHQLAVDLRFAMQNQEFFLLYQPIVDMQSSRIVKAEALVRWNHPSLGLLSPMEFIPIAEETGIIHLLGDWVFKTAVRQLLAWEQASGQPLQISINKSPVQFNFSHEESQDWYAFLRELGLSGERVIVEITESTMMNQLESTQRALLNFAAAGIQVAIDDFGTGYSSLAYLNKFDIDYLKIDKAFVHEMQKDNQSYHLCEALIVMAHKLGLKVVAEGVETPTQHALLQAMHCDFGQGYLYAKPLTAEAFAERLLAQGQA